MTRLEHLLTIAAEESAEVAQRISKALRFGLDEIEHSQEFTNAERIKNELTDLLAVVLMIEAEAKVLLVSSESYLESKQINAKMEKVEKYLAYSKLCGTLE